MPLQVCDQTQNLGDSIPAAAKSEFRPQAVNAQIGANGVCMWRLFVLLVGRLPNTSPGSVPSTDQPQRTFFQVLVGYPTYTGAKG
jgi:hypothetical protein